MLFRSLWKHREMTRQRSVGQSKAEIMKVKLWVVVRKIKPSKGVSIPVVVGRSRGNWYDFYGLPGSA